METNTNLSPKQQAVERIRQGMNVLVTVSTNPTVDQLAAAIGFTLMLNKLSKHATAVFSGQIPSTLEFLHPEETLERNTDSLRDFIISLDKAKADKLRYKVEENVVKIFITPYRTSISQNDLQFTQGDFNVDVVVALGVTNRDQLDQAIISHGRILHDATVITMTAGNTTSDLGAINWQEPTASSLCEMLVSISEAFQGNLLDGQMATAFLTGIVAETERFSNPRTSPKVMTMSAQLMAAGANQQLIATQLMQSFDVRNPESQAMAPTAVPNIPDPGALSIEHEQKEPDNNIHIDEHGNFQQSPTDAAQPPAPESSQPAPSEPPQDQPADQPPASQTDSMGHKIIMPPGHENDPPKTDLSKLTLEPPAFGGTLTANSTDQSQVLDPSTDPFSLPPVMPPNNEFSQNENGSLPGAPTDLPPLSLPPMYPDDNKPADALPQGHDFPLDMPTSPPPPSPPEFTPPPQFPPIPDTPPAAEPPPAAEQPPATEQPSAPELPPAPDLPVVPDVPTAPELPPADSAQTLVELEQEVHSPHVDAQQSGAVSPELEAARNAVEQVVSSSPFDVNRPDPAAGVGSAPLGTPIDHPPVDPNAVQSDPLGLPGIEGVNESPQPPGSPPVDGMLPPVDVTPPPADGTPPPPAVPPPLPPGTFNLPQ